MDCVVVFPKKERYKSDHVILDHESYEHDLKDFSFTFVELPKFTKSIEQLESIEDQWYYFLKYADESNDISDILAQYPEIKEAYDVLDRYHWSEDELLYYEKLIMNEADAYGVMEAAKKEARAEGLEEGRQEGILEGEKKKSLEVARLLLKQGLSVEQISQATGLSA